MSDQFVDQGVTSDDKLWAALAYIIWPIIPVLLLLMEDKKNRPFLKFHGVQSLVAGAAILIITLIISVPTFGCGSIVWLIMFYWAYKAYQGTMFEIPVVTNLIRQQGWA